MGKNLFITEKPSVAREFATLFNVPCKGSDGFYENGDTVVTWCVGHLVAMSYPEKYDEKYKKWNLSDLPFLPSTYLYEVIPDVARQYQTVHKMLHRADISTVYWAGDSGREGQVIEELIRIYGGVRKGMVEKRIWIDSQTQEAMRNGIRDARPMSDYQPIGDAGLMREIEDYLMGINFSRALTVRYGAYLSAATGQKDRYTVAVGRVMTCVLGMVVDREREIRSFQETAFYRVEGAFETKDGAFAAEWKAVQGSAYFEAAGLYKDNGFLQKDAAAAFISSLSGASCKVKEVSKTLEKKRAPLLFNLAELQAECSKRFKISPDETLDVAQSLYEKKLTTYPRTDARVLSSAVAKEISKNLAGLSALSEFSQAVTWIEKEGRALGIRQKPYTDDSKVTDHYAIIPTGEIALIDELSSLERNVYTLICQRFLAIFFPPAVYAKTAVEVLAGEEHFFASKKVLTDPGFLSIYGQEAAAGEKRGEDRTFYALENGTEILGSSYTIREGKTSPPKRYTSGTMILAMENAGQLIEEEELREQIKGSGIGTSATRAETMKKLIRIGHICMDKKTQVVTPSAFGEMIYEVVSLTVPQMLNPRMTASWEKGLSGISDGAVTVAVYQQKLNQFVQKEVDQIKHAEIEKELLKRIKPFAAKNAALVETQTLRAKCPLCNGNVIHDMKGYHCIQYGNGCSFFLGSICGVALPVEQAEKLLTEFKTDVLGGFVSKKGTTFQAALCLNVEGNEKTCLSFSFPEQKDNLLSGVKCPQCGGDIRILQKGYGCANYKKDKSGCDFFLGEIGGKLLSQKDAKTLLTEGKTGVIKGFKKKNKEPFCAALALKKESGKVKVKFVFENGKKS